MARNPFTLALLNPAVVNRFPSTRNPFFMWSSSSIDVGGDTGTKNDLLIDGAPSQIGPKGSYSPPMDAVQEFSVQQNSVDAEFGHSAGGILSLGTKSGTNEWHGTAYYFGRNPALNALTNSVTNTPNQVRNHIWGGTVGHPIRKNKLFAFTAYEAWRQTEPRIAQGTLPTDLEREGDFSQSLNGDGGLCAIFDPWTTGFNAATGAVTRTPFPANRTPQARIDLTALRILQDVWKPNGPGTGFAGQNNFQTGYAMPIRYWNFSERVDWNISDAWKMFVRYSRVRTDLDSENYASSRAVPMDGGIMNNRNIAGDFVWIARPNMVFNFRGSYSSLEDDYDGSEIGEDGLAEFWPDNPWYKPYIREMPAIYYPGISVGGFNLGNASYWYQHPRHWAYSGSMRHTSGKHGWKAGGESRLHHSDGMFPALMRFNIQQALTANTFINPDTRRSGDQWATFLLGAIDNNSVAQLASYQRLGVSYYAGFVQDDIKLTPRITLNLGLRYEYETAPHDLGGYPRLSRHLDLDASIREMHQSPPQIPSGVRALMNQPHKFSGAWVFSDEKHRRMFNTNRHVFLPRAGIAIRLSDNTAVRAGFARYVVPPLIIGNTLRPIAMPYYSAATNVAPAIEGVPQARLSNPFPASNPLILPVGQARGRYTNLGDTASWNEQELRSAVNDRYNISLQRQMLGQIDFDATFFVNMGRDLPFSWRPNLMDPALNYQYKAELDRRVDNPFYQYLTPDKFPGPLRNQRQVLVRDLLKPYPHYGALSQNNTNGRKNHYYALQLGAQKTFAAGYSFLWAYNYNRDFSTEFFNIDDEYAGRFTYQNTGFPRHRLTSAGTYDLPFGKGRHLLNAVHPLANRIVGGWSTSWLFMLNSGTPLSFRNFPAVFAGGDPTLDSRTRERWFDTSKFRQLPAYTKRENPWFIDGLVGPKMWTLDITLSKYFPIRDRFQLEFKGEAYNLTNSFVPSDPVANVLSPLFGRTMSQANRGREVQYTLRIHF
ncbi:MAG: TonB-dependent receptor [Bryobacterales bacterium]|nr:TonB-dependent receptor [Bryobacterales bacterium]